MDHWEICDDRCPACGGEVRQQDCDVVGCDDGVIDLHESDDPVDFSPGEFGYCDECHGVGIVRWCPACGADLVYQDDALVVLLRPVGRGDWRAA